MSHRVTKPTKWPVHPVKTQISLGICPVWSGSLLSPWRNIGPLTTYWAYGEHSDQTGWMPRLIWVFAGHTCHFVGFVVQLLILSLSSSSSLFFTFCLFISVWRDGTFTEFQNSWNEQPVVPGYVAGGGQTDYDKEVGGISCYECVNCPVEPFQPEKDGTAIDTNCYVCSKEWDEG